jgi:hypothetical protein
VVIVKILGITAEQTQVLKGDLISKGVFKISCAEKVGYLLANKKIIATLPLTELMPLEHYMELIVYKYNLNFLKKLKPETYLIIDKALFQLVSFTTKLDYYDKTDKVFLLTMTFYRMDDNYKLADYVELKDLLIETL